MLDCILQELNRRINFYPLFLRAVFIIYPGKLYIIVLYINVSY